jgi:membrane associated rhomboid family serine protease
MNRSIITTRPTATIAILKINLFVYFSWIIGGSVNPTFMAQNFLLSWTGLGEGRYWTVITSVFSHSFFFHIFLNMYAFFGFGAALEQALGTRRFFRFYLGAGLLGSLSHVLVSAFLIGDPSLAALGASGAISGVILLFSLMFPTERILLMGVIPIPALFASFAIVALDVWGLIAQTRGGTLPIGHGAHLGGALYGFIYYLIVLRRRSGFRLQS